jgi:hypothetical protein
LCEKYFTFAKNFDIKMENAKKYKRNAGSPRVISLYKDVLEVKSCPYCNCKEYYVHGRYNKQFVTGVEVVAGHFCQAQGVRFTICIRRIHLLNMQRL